MSQYKIITVIIIVIIIIFSDRVLLSWESETDLRLSGQHILLY